MKKLFTLIALYISSLNVIYAEITWTLSDDGTLTISGTDMSDYSIRTAPWYSQQAKIHNVVIENGVTNIGKAAFFDCTALTSITIPESVTCIGEDAFSRCTSLTSITIPNSVTSIGHNAFQRTKWYNDQPDGLIYVGLVLYGYKGIMPENTNVVINEGTKSIVDYAFNGCSGLKSVVIPESVTSIGEYAFNKCSSLTSIAIPNSVTSIGKQTFNNCSCLTSVTIGNSVINIGEEAFQSCSRLTSVTIGNSVTNIGVYAFSGCSDLTSINIPNSVTSIGSSAFANCTGLTSVHITNLASWCKIKFGNYYANPLYCAEHLYLNGKEVNNLVVPSGVTSIGAYSFYSCKSITSVEIPNTVTNIGDFAFYGCFGLTSLTIPELVTNIGWQAFDGAKLRNIAIKANTPPSVGNSGFSNQSYYHTTLMVPEGSWDAYAYSDNWYQFINIREIAYNAASLKNSKAYMMKLSTEGSYIFYDSVNDCVGILNETAVDDTKENNTWMTIEVDDKHYVYNLGAKKFLVLDKINANQIGYTLSSSPISIDIEDGKNAIVFGKGKEFYMVINDKLNVDESIESQIIASTGIKEISENSHLPAGTYNLNGQRIEITHALKGIFIKNGKKYAK